ncbi:forkhead box C1-A-like [Patella vulgata]|uniref:forkhead box C1-A-like n=1 Tax=Patella vulgata TaxID=6465 RepID=UPI0021806210|nr:forkhead box C1-A-like [Patella vulgata]
MCSSNAGTLLPYGLKIPTPSPYFPFAPGVGNLPLDVQRSQLCDYAARLQYGLRGYPGLGISPYHAHLPDPYTQAYLYKHDLRARYIQEEPKPSQSYIGLISMAILGAKDKKLILSDIYQWILDNYAYFRTRGPGWRNSIRHNLSLNDCFIKSGRSANGKGHYWAIHPANIDDFARGDFRRRRAQRKVRKHMGLAVPDDEDSPSPSPSTTPINWQGSYTDERPDGPKISQVVEHTTSKSETECSSATGTASGPPVKKRLFDMESILAPDHHRPSQISNNHIEEVETEIEIDTDRETVDVCEIDSQHSGDEQLSPSSPPSSPHSDGKLSPPVNLQHDTEPGEIKPEVNNTFSTSKSEIWSLGNVIPNRPGASHMSGQAPWDAYATYIYPMLSTSYSVVLPGTSPISAEAASRWREAMYASAPEAKSSLSEIKPE